MPKFPASFSRKEEKKSDILMVSTKYFDSIS